MTPKEKFVLLYTAIVTLISVLVLIATKKGWIRDPKSRRKNCNYSIQTSDKPEIGSVKPPNEKFPFTYAAIIAAISIIVFITIKKSWIKDPD